MLLSEAIAMGSLVVRPRATREWYEGGTGCARGMALEAVGRRIHVAAPPTGSHGLVFLSVWPWTGISEHVLPCACGSPELWAACNVITHIFDSHVMQVKDWTLPQLIEWIRSVEPKETEEKN